MTNTTQVLSRGIVRQMLTDNGFYAKFPEFGAIRNKLQAVSLDSNQGCRGCKTRKVEKNLFGDFLLILRALTPERTEQLKQYMGVGGLMYNVQNAETGAYETKVI
jgi:hypothetical protein